VGKTQQTGVEPVQVIKPPQFAVQVPQYALGHTPRQQFGEHEAHNVEDDEAQVWAALQVREVVTVQRVEMPEQ
jgi:hypothetical protein